MRWEIKAKELTVLQLEHPDFEVMLFISGKAYEEYCVTGIADVGYADKLIILETD
jgi:hypothetical protein